MQNKNIFLVILMVIFVIGIAAFLSLRFFYPEEQIISQIKDIKTAGSIEEFIASAPELLTEERAKLLGLAKNEIALPLPSKLPDLKITLVPQMVVGGDTVYVPVASFSGNKYFILKPDNIKNIFTVNNPEEAIKYIELAVVNLGWSTYDRVKKVVNKSEDYDTIGCRIMPEDQNNPLPASRPVSNAVKTPRGYEVTLVYFTPVNPAGY
jgi:hypothetical protein